MDPGPTSSLNQGTGQLTGNGGHQSAAQLQQHPTGTPPSTTTNISTTSPVQMQEMVQLVLQLTDVSSAVRENALLELSKKREEFPDLAPILWHSFGTIAALLQEIIVIYPSLSPPVLSASASNRVCNALALLQCVASHVETRSLFLQGRLLRTT